MLLLECGNALLGVSLPPCTVRELAEFESRGVKAACVSDLRNLPRLNNRVKASERVLEREKSLFAIKVQSLLDIQVTEPGYANASAPLRAHGAHSSSLILDRLSHPATVRCLARLFLFERMLLVPDT